MVHVVDAQYVGSAPVLDALPAPMLAEIAFGGRSNVGKSSLINALLQRRKLVRTSATPGRTRAIQIFRVRVRGTGQPPAEADFDLVDLPGYGYAKVSKRERRGWGPLIEGFLQRRAGLRGVVILIDARRGIEDDDRELIEFVEHVKREPILVATKLDKVTPSRRTAAVRDLAREVGRRVVGFSAEAAIGREELWREVLRVAGIDLRGGQPPLAGAVT